VSVSSLRRRPFPPCRATHRGLRRSVSALQGTPSGRRGPAPPRDGLSLRALVGPWSCPRLTHCDGPSAHPREMLDDPAARADARATRVFSRWHVWLGADHWSAAVLERSVFFAAP